MRLNVTELFIVSKIFLLIRFVTEKQVRKTSSSRSFLICLKSVDLMLLF
jgi:hypothetical protein